MIYELVNWFHFVMKFDEKQVTWYKDYFLVFSNDNSEVNFKEFMKTLARFRPVKENKTNELNCRDEKLKCTF